jgi:hypothetical protein
MRITVDGRKHQRIMMDPLDREIMESRIVAVTHCYHRLTTHKIALGFSRPSVFQQKIIDQRAGK